MAVAWPCHCAGGAGGAPVEGGKKISAKELRMIERERAAAAKASAAASKNASIFGDMPLVQSQAITDKVWTR